MHLTMCAGYIDEWFVPGKPAPHPLDFDGIIALNKDPDVVCRVCFQRRTPEGFDPCLGELPGVNFACCGHGGPYGYITFTNDVAIYFDTKRVYPYVFGRNCIMFPSPIEDVIGKIQEDAYVLSKNH